MLCRTVRSGQTQKPLLLGMLRRVRAGGLLLSVWPLLAAHAPAQTNPPAPPYLINTWGTEHGLPQNIVNALAQTPDGYLWCGTAHGLAHFDGLRFRVFKGENVPELGSGRIRQLLADRRGGLWITTTEGGLTHFADGRFRTFEPPPRDDPSRAFVGLADDDAGNLWLNAEDGATVLFSGGVFKVVSKEWDPARLSFHKVQADPKGQLWVVSGTDLARLEDGKPVSVLHGRPAEYLFLCPGRSGGWWIQTAGQVQLWRDGQWVADLGEALPPETRVESCLEDQRGHLWVGSLGQGLFCYSSNQPPQRIATRDGLGSDLVRTLLEDNEGNLWVGTRAGGLSRLRPALFQVTSKKDGLASDLVTAVCEGPRGELWVGTDGAGLDCLKDGHVKHYAREQGLDGLYVRTLLFDRVGQLWVGSWPGGLFRFQGERFVSIRNYPSRSPFLACMLEDSQGRLWLGQRSTNRVVRLHQDRGETLVLPNPRPSADLIAFAEDASGSVWVGTDGQGLYRYQGNQCQRFTRQDGLPSNTVRALYADPAGALGSARWTVGYAGSRMAGLSRLTPETAWWTV